MCYCPLHFVRAVCEHAKDTNKESQINIHYTTTAKLKQTNKQKKIKQQNIELAPSLVPTIMFIIPDFISFAVASLTQRHTSKESARCR